MRLYTRSCKYTIRALAEMASRPQAGPFRAADVCRAAGIPEAYTRKTFQILVKAGFLKATPGPGGGYRMVADATVTTLRQVVEAVDGTEAMDACILGHACCDSRHPCALHPMWKTLKAQMFAELDRITVYAAGESIARARASIDNGQATETAVRRRRGKRISTTQEGRAA